MNLFRFLQLFFIVCFICLIISSIGEAQSATKKLRSRKVRCPVVIADLQLGEYKLSSKNYSCFNNRRDAKLEGFAPFVTNTTIVATPVPAQNCPATVTATPTPVVTVPPVPTIPPNAQPKSFVMLGKGNAASEVITFATLPWTITYKTVGTPTDRFQILARDPSNGRIIRQLLYTSGMHNNVVVGTFTGKVYLEIKATEGMNWSMLVNYE